MHLDFSHTPGAYVMGIRSTANHLVLSKKTISLVMFPIITIGEATFPISILLIAGRTALLVTMYVYDLISRAGSL